MSVVSVTSGTCVILLCISLFNEHVPTHPPAHILYILFNCSRRFWGSSSLSWSLGYAAHCWSWRFQTEIIYRLNGNTKIIFLADLRLHMPRVLSDLLCFCFNSSRSIEYRRLHTQTYKCMQMYRTVGCTTTVRTCTPKRNVQMQIR